MSDLEYLLFNIIMRLFPEFELLMEWLKVQTPQS